MPRPKTATPPETLTLERLPTPFGPILVAADPEGRLCAVEFWNDEAEMRRLIAHHHGAAKVEFGAVAAPIREAFARYFAGDREALEAVPLNSGGTEFQQQVWKALTTIPVGETWSYAQLAAAIGRPTAVRAVGLANGANPIPIAVPCHRVIGANGSLTGFGGGLDRKRWLLRHEGAAFDDTARAHETRAVTRRLERRPAA
ncbi:MAG TPA: methylated-DNA--[protein]-cysteine S-methyltransferase [Caulobacteraceae bacterium]|nr:methylated-DNA--[protein]-cysteine S-methyltransferase [Caulobacteraceae bacterium]